MDTQTDLIYYYNAEIMRGLNLLWIWTLKKNHAITYKNLSDVDNLNDFGKPKFESKSDTNGSK